MFSLNQLHLGTTDGRDFVLCAAHSLDIPPGTEPESPTETLWQLRRSLSRFGVSGLRDFLRRNNLALDFSDASSRDDSVQILERMIERKQVIGCFLQGGSERSRTLSVSLAPFSADQISMPLPALALAAGSPSGKSARRAYAPQQGPGGLGSPHVGLSDATGDHSTSLPSGSGTSLPPSDLVAVANKYLGGNPDSEPPSSSAPGSEPDAAPSAPGATESDTTSPPIVVPGATTAASTPKNIFPEHIFTVEVVDELGNCIPGIKLDFGSAAPVATDGNGPAVFRGKPSNAKVSFADGQDIYEALVAARANRPATPAAKCLAPSADVLVFIARPGIIESLDGSPFAPFSMQAGEKKRVSLRPGAAKAKIFEIRDTLFRLKSAVVNPECEAPSSTLGDHPAETSVGLIANVLRYNAEHRGLKIFIAGHTDTSGDAINKPLSEQRAFAVQALVEGNRKMFLDACTKYNSEVDATQVFDWSKRVFGFKCNPTTLTASPSDTNYVLFRKSFNDWVDAGAKAGEKRGTKIDYNGRANVQPDIWGAFFDLYEYQLLQELGETANGLGELRGKLDWVNPQIRSRGYGETHPLSKPPLDGMHSQTDRRVEVMLFESNHLPDLAGDPQGNTLYDGNSFEPVVIPPMTDATRAPITVELRDTSDSPIPGVTVELYLGTAVFGQGVTDTSGRCMVKGPRVPSIWMRITAIDESVLTAGVSNNDVALYAEEYAEGRNVIVGSMISVVLTPCTLAIALEASQVGSPKRTAELRSSDGTVVRTLPLPPPIVDEVEQSVVFDDLPTFGKKYSLTIKTGSDEAIAFENLSIGALIAEIESARSDLVDVEPESNRRQAALENPNTGIVVV